MQLRKNPRNVEQVVVKMRNSLMEPALRLKHSLQEPVMYKPFADPGLRLSAVTASVTSATAQTVPAASSTTATHLSSVTTVHGGAVTAPLGPIGTAKRIVQREGFLALYKGLTAVYTGIIPKMAIRFVSFEQYRDFLGQHQDRTGMSGTAVTFTAGLGSGLTEAILVVTPSEVCKVRMMGQYHSLMDPTQLARRKYTNVLQTAMVISREEGIGALYKGVVPTMLRQGCNQAVNFTAYNAIKRSVMEYQGSSSLEHWQSLLIGGLSGGMGPLVNNPLDVVKTRLQKQVVTPGKPPKYSGLLQSVAVIAREEGVLALWKGITPRLLRIMPGQAITFMTYEAVSTQMKRFGILQG
jgi:solute carrier family 25 (mitochondrial citrate transporter), member 1